MRRRGMRRRGVQIYWCTHPLGTPEESLIRRIVELAALAVPVDQSTDKAQFGNGTLQFGGRGVWVLRRQCRETSESVGIFAHRLSQVIVGAAGQIDRARHIGLVLDTRVEKRQDLEIDSGSIHLLET